MSHVPHELHEVFPDHQANLHDLKVSDAHFARLHDAYHILNRDIHRAETDIEPVADFTLEEWKKRRLAMLDEITHLLNA